MHADVTLEGGLALGEQACFELDGPAGPVGARQCVSSSPSSINFQNVPLGSYSIAVHYQSVVGSTAVAQIPPRFVVPAAVPVNLTQAGATANVSISAPLRKLLVSVQTGTLFPGSGFCFDLDPGPASGAPLVSACDDSRGVGLILAANLWPGVQYVLRFTSAPDAYAVPAQQLVGPFDDTTELNRVDALSGPAGSVHVNVTWQGGRSSAPFDFNGVCASLSPGGPTVPVFPPEGCLRDDGTMSFDHTPVGDYQVLFGRTFVNFLSQYVMPGPAQVSVTQGATASVDIQIPTRKLLVTVHPQGALFPGPGFCYDMIPDLPHADQLTSSACDDSFGLGLIGVDHLWGGVPYTLHFTSAPAAYALPPDQIVGPFDDTTEVNHVDVNAGPAGQARFSVLFENGPPTPNTGSACFYLTGPGVVSAVQCTDHDGDLFFDQLPFGTYTTHIATGGPASQPNQVPQGYVVPDSIQVGASDVRQAPQTVVVHKRRLEVHAGSPATGPQPGLCYSFLIRLSLLGDLPIADFCDADDGASDGTATFGASSTQLVSNDTTYVLHVHSNPFVPASEMEKVLGPFDQTTNPQVVNVTTADNHAPDRGERQPGCRIGNRHRRPRPRERLGARRRHPRARIGQHPAARDGDDPGRHGGDQRDRDLAVRYPPPLHL